MMRVATIGFTRKGAQRFFELIEGAGVRTVVDVRLRPDSQLSGFAKGRDLAYFLDRLSGAEYRHEPLLAPSPEILSAYKNEKAMDWGEYERRFLALMAERRIEQRLQPEDFEDACLLCSEHLPHRCHRRLVVEYLQERWQIPMRVEHLK